MTKLVPWKLRGSGRLACTLQIEVGLPAAHEWRVSLLSETDSRAEDGDRLL